MIHRPHRRHPVTSLVTVGPTLYSLLFFIFVNVVSVHAGGSFTHTLPFGTEECLLIRVPTDLPHIIRCVYYLYLIGGCCKVCTCPSWPLIIYLSCTICIQKYKTKYSRRLHQLKNPISLSLVDMIYVYIIHAYIICINASIVEALNF